MIELVKILKKFMVYRIVINMKISTVIWSEKCKHRIHVRLPRRLNGVCFDLRRNTVSWEDLNKDILRKRKFPSRLLYVP